jgi:hypothetical protein
VDNVFRKVFIGRLSSGDFIPKSYEPGSDLIAQGFFEVPPIEKDLNNQVYRVKNTGIDKEEIILGDETQPSIFKPRVKLTRWKDPETQIPENAISIYHDDIVGQVKFIGGKLSIGNSTREFFVCSKDDDNIEFGLRFLNNPGTNLFEFHVEGHEDFDFLYQPALTSGEIGAGDVRPDDIVGSYAIYHKTKKNHVIGKVNYRSGKFGHIKRPKFIDANLDQIWGDLSFNPSTGILSVTGSQTWLNNAVYPVVLDPTIGYETVGGSNQNGIDYIIGEVGTTDASGGTGDKMSASGFESDEPGHQFKTAIYSTAGVFLTNSNTTQRTNLTTTQQFNDFSFPAAPTLAVATSYVVVVWCGDPGGIGGTPRVAYDAGGGTIGRYVGSAYGANFPTPVTFDTIDRRYSVHCDYTSGGATSILPLVATGSLGGRCNPMTE